MGGQLEALAPDDRPDEPGVTGFLAPTEEEGQAVLSVALKTFHHFFGAFSPLASRRA